MIKRVFSNHKSFREVAFEKGFNVVLADKHPDSTSKDSRNGVGKTLLIEIIHFCLGADAKKGKGLLVDKLMEHTFSIELTLNERLITVHRSVLDPQYVDVEGDYSAWPITPQYNGNTKTHRLSMDSWRLVLGHFLFDLSIEGETYSPTFRSLFSYFARRGIGAFNDSFKYFPQQSAWSVQVNNNYLLGINWEYAKEFQSLKDRSATLDGLRKAAQQGWFDDVMGTMGELQAERIRYTEDLLALENNIKEFKVHPQYKEMQKEADDLTGKIHQLLNKINVDERILREYEKSVSVEKDVSAQKVRDLYGKAGVSFPKELIRSLEDVEHFHTVIVSNRKEYLQNEELRLKDTITKRRNEIELLSSRRAVAMKLLQSHGALEEYDALLEKKATIREKLERVKSAIANLSAFENGKSALKIEQEELLRKARMDKVERSATVDKAISLFNKNSTVLYERPGVLAVDIQKSGYTYNIEIERSGSQGINYMKVFCYDLTLSQLWSEVIKDHVLIHDSTIFDGVDERQTARSLELATSEAEARGFQYICTLNSDDVPNGEFSSEFKKKFDASVRLTLTDKEPEQSLLGFRF